MWRWGLGLMCDKYLTEWDNEAKRMGDTKNKK